MGRQDLLLSLWQEQEGRFLLLDEVHALVEALEARHTWATCR